MGKPKVVRIAAFHAILLAILSFPVLAGEPCPPLLAGMMPKGVVKVSGQYTSQGMIGMGSAAAELPFENICANQTTKYPGRVTFAVQHYTGEGVPLLKMQVDAVEQQEKRSKPSARLFGVAHTAETRLTVEVEGFISKEAARSAAIEVIENFVRAGF